LSSLHNAYYLLRHGRSHANAQGLIVSNVAVGRIGFGLTEDGALEVQSNLLAIRNELPDIARIHASDFLRTRQTAMLASETFGAPVELTPRLRERGFGDFEGRSSDLYDRVWEQDAVDPAHTRWNVESVHSVAARLIEYVLEIDQSGSGETHLLVSHGDPLQILITAAAGDDLRRHRQIEPLHTAEIRLLRT
jgi:probable phosphoglycerate mutase